MIEQSIIETHLKEILADAGCFLVEIRVDKSNRILVHVDRDEGVSITDCVNISRELETRLDRDSEDFALEVSSPGLDSPFKVIEQYYKNRGNKVKVVLEGGETLEGILNEVSNKDIVIDTGKGGMVSMKIDAIQSTRRVIQI